MHCPFLLITSRPYSVLVERGCFMLNSAHLICCCAEAPSTTLVQQRCYGQSGIYRQAAVYELKQIACRALQTAGVFMRFTLCFQPGPLASWLMEVVVPNALSHCLERSLFSCSKSSKQEGTSRRSKDGPPGAAGTLLSCSNAHKLLLTIACCLGKVLHKGCSAPTRD